MKYFTLSLLALLIASPAAAASFDCAKASHVVEKIICDHPDISRMDEEMAAVYKDRLAAMVDKEGLRAMQKDWMALMRKNCKDAPCVDQQYRDQLTMYERAMGEDFSYNYKTGDETVISISGQSPAGFDFFIDKNMVDTGESICRLPLLEGDGLLKATYTSPDTAVWERPSAPACKIIFKILPDKENGTTWIEAIEDGCGDICNGQSMLSAGARFERTGAPVPGNQ